MNETNHSDSTLSPSDTHTSTGSDAPLWRRRWRLIAASGGVLTIGFILVLWLAGRGDASDSAEGMSARVQLGPLTVSVTETGEIEAEQRKVIANELRWPVIILDLVDEGEVVGEGQTIVQFECKELVDAIEKEQLDVTSAQNSYTQAEQNLELKEEEVANKILKAQRALDGAIADRDQYVKHDYPISLANRENAVMMSERRLQLAEDELGFKKRVNEMPDMESPYSANEIKADELSVQEDRNNLKKAKLEYEKLKEYEHKRKLRDLTDAIDDAGLGFKRAELEAKNELLITKANKQAKERTLKMRTDRLDEYLEDQKKLTVKAEMAGLVVYDTGRNRWQQPIRVAIGEKINQRQQIMVIPEMSSLQINTKVYEAIIDQVTEGLPARIRLDARPDEVLKGTVSKVSVLPDSQNRWLNPGIKTYSVTVKFDRMVEGLKPGMTAEVELELARLDNVLSVPIAAVFTEQSETVCYRQVDGGCERVGVRVGRMNDRRVEIESGLSKGDAVLLSRPSELLRTIELPRAEAGRSDDTRRPTSAPASAPAPTTMEATTQTQPARSAGDSTPARARRPRGTRGGGRRGGGRR